MDIQRILNAGIPDIHPVYGGVRGRTMSSHLQAHAWPEVVASGVKTVIDLRDGDMAERYGEICRRNGIEYFHYPVDNSCGSIERMVRLFPRFCEIIDNGDFFISCAQGLHRTDVALITYWVFYGADKGLNPPAVVGYHEDRGRNPEKIMRVLNAFYKHLSEINDEPPMSHEVFKTRKKIINELSAKPSSDNSKTYFPIPLLEAE